MLTYTPIAQVHVQEHGSENQQFYYFLRWIDFCFDNGPGNVMHMSYIHCARVPVRALENGEDLDEVMELSDANICMMRYNGVGSVSSSIIPCIDATQTNNRREGDQVSDLS